MLAAWLANHGAAAVDARALQAGVDDYMAAFDAGEAAAAGAAASLAASMEADGFTLVGRGRRSVPGAIAAGGGGALPGGAPGAAAAGRRVSDNRKRKAKRGTLLVDDFYKYQMLGSKIDALARLREGFAADSERARKIAATARAAFRPAS